MICVGSFVVSQKTKSSKVNPLQPLSINATKKIRRVRLSHGFGTDISDLRLDKVNQNLKILDFANR